MVEMILPVMILRLIMILLASIISTIGDAKVETISL